MDDLWRAVGMFPWWLIFPVGALVGGYLRRRHVRQLETMRLESELRVAELNAQAGLPQGSTTASPIAASQPASSSELLGRLFAEHDEITARWLDYELDVAKVIAFPAMSDGRQPLTAAFLRAKKTADALRPGSADAKVTERQVSEYLDAVGNYAVAFEVAEKDARRLRDSSFTEDERKRLERAQHMLKVAVDESATSAERQTAYRRVREELDGLIDLSDAAVENLEKRVALQLEPGQAPEADRSATPVPQADPLPVRDPLSQADPLRPAAPSRNPEP
ncbi:hypothetical protein [Microbacterium panaciterrae]|uniref:Secreted protein n=1 Tax=Microbacterium panaciterrae TaxID=985759 RepID=A0ABP8PP02_9MICO